jgi:hypothetical protein
LAADGHLLDPDKASLGVGVPWSISVEGLFGNEDEGLVTGVLYAVLDLLQDEDIGLLGGGGVLFLWFALGDQLGVVDLDGLGLYGGARGDVVDFLLFGVLADLEASVLLHVVVESLGYVGVALLHIFQKLLVSLRDNLL